MTINENVPYVNLIIFVMSKARMTDEEKNTFSVITSSFQEHAMKMGDICKIPFRSLKYGILAVCFPSCRDLHQAFLPFMKNDRISLLEKIAEASDLNIGRNTLIQAFRKEKEDILKEEVFFSQLTLRSLVEVSIAV